MDCGPPGSSVRRFSRQEYWSGLSFPPSGELPNPGIEPRFLRSPALAAGFFTTCTTWEALVFAYYNFFYPSTFTFFVIYSIQQHLVFVFLINPFLPCPSFNWWFLYKFLYVYLIAIYLDLILPSYLFFKILFVLFSLCSFSSAFLSFCFCLTTFFFFRSIFSSLSWLGIFAVYFYSVIDCIQNLLSTQQILKSTIFS